LKVGSNSRKFSRPISIKCSNDTEHKIYHLTATVLMLSPHCKLHICKSTSSADDCWHSPHSHQNVLVISQRSPYHLCYLGVSLFVGFFPRCGTSCNSSICQKVVWILRKFIQIFVVKFRSNKVKHFMFRIIWFSLDLVKPPPTLATPTFLAARIDRGSL
jgi:hypothetical protein